MSLYFMISQEEFVQDEMDMAGKYFRLFWY